MRETRLPVFAMQRFSKSISALVALAVGMLNPLGMVIADSAIPAQTETRSTVQVPPRDRLRSPREPSSAEPQLVEGLLELLERESPAPADAQEPLAIVRQQMLHASDLLRKGGTAQQTWQLQETIVSQLDAFIKQLQQSQNCPVPNVEQSSVHQQIDQPSQKIQSQSEKAGKPSGQPNADANQPNDAGQVNGDQRADSSDSDPAGAGQGTSTSPGITGVGSASSVQLNSPAELQQRVWGHLPQQVRSQMQSRMVEEFLPSYRQQLEAYYRTLLNRESNP